MVHLNAARVVQRRSISSLTEENVRLNQVTWENFSLVMLFRNCSTDFLHLFVYFHITIKGTFKVINVLLCSAKCCNVSSFLINWNQFISFQAAVFQRSRWSKLLVTALHSLWQLKAFSGPVAPPAAPQIKQDGALPRAQWRPGCGRPTQKFSLNFSESSLLVCCIVGRQRPNSAELHQRGQRRQAELDIATKPIRQQDAGLML